MRTILLSVLAAVMGLPIAAQAQRDRAPMGVSVELREQVRDSYIFVFDASVARTDVRGLAAALTARANGRLGHVYRNSIRGFSATLPAAAAERLAAMSPQIAYYEPDGVVFAIMGPPGGGGGSLPPQETPWGITRVGGPADGTGKTAFIIDTGIDLDHDDLNVDVARSVNFVSRGRDNGGDDENGHGSHVAGTLGAIDNDIGVVGVAANATLVSVRVLDRNGSGSFADVIAGVDHVAANGAPGDVANMSLGGGFSQSLNDAVAAAANNGIFFSIAAGNESQDANNVSPASTEHPNVYTVSAMDSTDTFASFSNFGNPPVDCAAPGVGVLSTFDDNGLATLSGTSMAAPHVGGILLATGGMPAFDGTVSGDPDGDPDPICSL